MKTPSLLIAIALVSPYALAQVSAASQPTPAGVPPTASGATDISGTSATPQDASSSGASSSGTASGASSGAVSGATSGTTNGMRAEAGADLPPPPSPIARLKPVTHEDVTYLCGGVGEEEIAYMKQQARDYDMMLTFAARDGAYLADVDVDIKDAKGNTVLQTACDSPIMLVDLPRGGSYRVRAETAGYSLNRTVRVAGAGNKRQRVASTILSWPQQVAEAGGPATSTGGSGSAQDSGAASGSGSR
ncbi:MAG TPA: hypothetical protein VEC01_06255 [Noviherbaspirillum sp.]|uniref:hypothetical protein n=1 Tax=Noviherbaspirillum sp. TaxID=1926288 RepID=UPI002D3BB254|nr:hypothetical protein [Noviherbaspirillum sp.]HYD94909.1 hypothetical protein [Noviherbaspirillum sp.]